MGDWCRTCGEYLFDGLGIHGRGHKCPPKWFVASVDEIEQFEDDPRAAYREVYATDFDGAAEAWAEQDDAASSGYPIASGSAELVEVRNADFERVGFVHVSGEFTPNYSAGQALDPNKPLIWSGTYVAASVPEFAEPGSGPGYVRHVPTYRPSGSEDLTPGYHGRVYVLATGPRAAQKLWAAVCTAAGVEQPPFARFEHRSDRRPGDLPESLPWPPEAPE